MFDNCLTTPVSFKASIDHLTALTMQEKTINIRDLVRNYRKLSEEGKIFIILNHGVPENVLVPYKEWQNKTKNRSVKITRELIDKYSFDSGIPDLSQKVDEIVYGSSNPHRDDDT